MLTGCMDTVEISQTQPEATGCFIFLHGAGRNGEWQKEVFLNLLGSKAAFPHIKIVFPTAPEKYYELKEKVTNVWFAVTMVKGYPVCSLPNIDESCESLEGLVQDQIRQGIRPDRIVVGGISQGGILALHYVYRYNRKLAGCVASSAVLSNEHCILDAVRYSSKRLPPLLMTHGVEDDKILYHFAKDSYEKLKKMGVDVDFHSYPEASHEFIPEQLELIFNWVSSLLPE